VSLRVEEGYMCEMESVSVAVVCRTVDAALDMSLDRQGGAGMRLGGLDDSARALCACQGSSPDGQVLFFSFFFLVPMRR
jgi:hypothetical protein